MVRKHFNSQNGFVRTHALWLAAPAVLLSFAALAQPAATDEISPDLPVRIEIEKPDPNLHRGKELFAQLCATCHGNNGRGDGPTARELDPRPTDFTTGVYKIRSTPQGTTPTREDLYRTLTLGIPGTAMPGWMGLPAVDRWQLVYHLESLAPEFATRRGIPISIPTPTPATVEAIERGRAIYTTLQCVQCHGANGRGDGPTADNLVDDSGRQVYPFNFGRSAKFKGGGDPGDIYRTIHTGLDGTPMKSFEGMISERDTWALVHFIRSLRLDAPLPDVVSETEAETYTARISSLSTAIEVARIDAEAARAEATKAQAEALATRAQLTALLDKSATEEREAMAQATAAKAEKDRVEKAKSEKASAAKAKAAERRALLSEAKKLYRSRCAVCHGAGGRGDGPAAGGLQPKPRDLSDPAWQSSVSNRDIDKLIVGGGPALGKSPVMPPNPDLAGKPEVVAQIRKMVRAFKRK